MSARQKPKFRDPRRCAVAGLFAVVAAFGVTGPVLAAGWSWPWEDAPEERPPPREPPPAYRDDQPPGTDDGAAGPAHNNVCLQLEQRLAQEGQRGAQSHDRLPEIEIQIREADRAARQAEDELERRDCYDYFLFTKTLRRSRQCNDLAAQSADARRHVGDLQAQRQEFVVSGGRSYRDEIVRELARQGCGATYQQQAAAQRRRDSGSSFWGDESEGESGGANAYGAQPFATYRTLCVRLCDGYYFPISFSTLPSHFDRDEDSCHSKCAAPAELYYHQNPGGAVEQMVSARSQELYTKLKTAFRYRKEYVTGCSCKTAEYAPEPQPADGWAPTAKRAEAPAVDGSSPREALPWQSRKSE